MQKVEAESPCVDLALQGAVRCRHQPETAGRVPARAESSILVRIDGTKQLRLRFQRQAAHLVQQQCAAIGLLELAGLRRLGTGKCAFFVAEQG
ncbi:MAG TPA: hypothetical protein PLR99_26390, partial [Polyangiaceae bacterium]|nr:hypothetical protein [Polyangiaceae bacterium]